jgi:hypothetical protein
MLVIDEASHLFWPEVVTPAQFEALFRGVDKLCPEEALMLAVLEDAVSHFQQYTFAENPAGRQLFRETEEWIWSDDETWPFSFVNICYVLGFDPDALRQGLKRWKEKEGQRRAAIQDETVAPVERRRDHARV